MVLKAYKPVTYTATIRFEDNTTVEADFRLPRSIDYFKSAEGNLNKDNLMTFANTCMGFKKPVQVELEDGSIINATNMLTMIDLGIQMDISDVLLKWYKQQEKAQEVKDELVKKSKSVGNSTKKATQEKM